MPDYRRIFRPGGTYFFTIVTHLRRRLLADEANVQLLKATVAQIRQQHPFEIDAAVVLPDHIHFIWTLPEHDSDYSTRIGKIKAAFTKRLREVGTAVNRQPRSGYSDVRQPRFWEHTIRDQGDLNTHLDYVHYNPVKHGYVRCPHEWTHSSFPKRVAQSDYELTWCCCCDGRMVEPPDFSSIGEWAGE
jgi:putative transposase